MIKQSIFKNCETYKKFIDDKGSLIAFNEIESFETRRTFIINCKKNIWRGKHYHKKTTQIILVLSGEINVKITDSTGDKQTAIMSEGSYYKQLPYTQFEFSANSEDALILALCDTEHDSNDYYVLNP